MVPDVVKWKETIRVPVGQDTLERTAIEVSYTLPTQISAFSKGLQTQDM